MDLTAQEDQGGFNSCPIILQLGTGSGAGPSNADNQYMYCSGKVLNSYRVGLDLTAQRNLGESDSHPLIPPPTARPRIEPSNLDFSKSMAQLLGSLDDLNENFREEFGVVAACSDNWRCTIGSCLTSQEDRLSKLEHN